MNNIVFSIFTFIIITAVIEQFLPDNKISSTVKPIIFCAVIISVLSLLGSIKFNNSDYNEISEQNEINTMSVWQCVTDNCETALEDNMKELCDERSLNIEDIKVDIRADNDIFKIRTVEINGIDTSDAKYLISSYYSIPPEYIHIDGG